MSENKSKTAKEIAVFLEDVSKHLEIMAEDHPTLRGLVGQINRKAESMLKPKEAQVVQLSYKDGKIIIEKMPYLHRSAFGAWRFKLSEALGNKTGTRINGDGDTVPVYASTFDKELGKNVFPVDCKDVLLNVIGNFFPDSPIEEI